MTFEGDPPSIEPMPAPHLRELAAAMDIELDDADVAALALFAGWLLDATQRVNLTTITEPRDVERRHLADALSLLPPIAQWAVGVGRSPDEPLKLIDVGTGGGVPGLPLALAMPTWRVTLVDSVAKKARLLAEAAAVLGVSDRVRSFGERAEVLASEPPHREAYDVAIARAVAPLPVLLEWLHPLTRVGGLIVCPQGDHQTDEATTRAVANRFFPGTLVETIDANVPELPGRRIALLAKTQPTPRQFPRAINAARTDPLSAQV